MSLDAATVKAAAAGRWLFILEALAPALHPAIPKRGRHVACPVHGGTDGFRLFRDADQTGGGICNTCGDFADGFALLQWVNGWDFPTTLRAVADHLGLVGTNGHAAGERTEADRREYLARLWHEARPDEGRLAVYLRSRGLSGAVPKALRFHPSLGYYDADRRHLGDFPAMVARVQRLDGEMVALHRTYLAADGPGKAPVDRAKKLTQAVREGATKGAAIRLAEAAGDTLALTEGVETGLAVMEATGLPTWATGSAGGLEAVELPSHVTRVRLYADHDASGRGQQAAATAAGRFRAEGREVAVYIPPAPDTDWLDVLTAEGPEAIRRAVATPPAAFSSFSSFLSSPRETAAKGSGFPEPPDPRAFHGLAGEFARRLEPHTEADPVAILMQFLVMFGNVIGRGPHVRIEADRHHTNLFAVMVGATAKGRKGVSKGQASRPFHAVDAEWATNRVQGGLSSGEGLIWAVRDPIRREEPVKEKGRVVEYQEVVADAGVADKRLLVFEPEFASTLRVMGRDGNTLSAIVRQAWDSGTLRVLTKSFPAVATDAHIAILGHITRGELLRYLDATEKGNGFANRFCFVAVRRSKVLPRGGALDHVDLGPIIRGLGGALRFARQLGARAITWDEEGGAYWDAIYPALSEPGTGLAGEVTSRAEAQVLRLSLLYALLDECDVIRRVHVEAAEALWRYCEASVRWIFGDSLGDPVADEILGELRRRHPEGMTRTDIMGFFKRNQTTEALGRALAVLEERGLAICRRDVTGERGRPAERWYATRGNERNEENEEIP